MKQPQPGSRHGDGICTTNKVLREARELLKATGQPFTLVEGKRHIKATLAGKFIGVLCKNGRGGRDTRMIQDQIKRRLRELQCS